MNLIIKEAPYGYYQQKDGSIRPLTFEEKQEILKSLDKLLIKIDEFIAKKNRKKNKKLSKKKTK